MSLPRHTHIRVATGMDEWRRSLWKNDHFKPEWSWIYFDVCFSPSYLL